MLPLSVALLRQDRPDAGQTAEGAVGAAELVASRIWSFAENVAQAAGAEPKSGAGDRARERLYSALETPYRAWLADLGPGRELAGARAEWQRIVAAACRPVTEELLAAAPPAAWTGRTVHKRLMNVALAEAWFNAALRKALPLAFPRWENTPLEAAG